MIIIESNGAGISVKGHANYAEHGKDIVCAAVSTLIQTLIASIEDLTDDKIQYVIQPGTVDIKHGNLSERGQLLIDSFFVGVRMIENEYPDYVRIAQAVDGVKSYGKTDKQKSKKYGG